MTLSRDGHGFIATRNNALVLNSMTDCLSSLSRAEIYLKLDYEVSGMFPQGF